MKQSDKNDSLYVQVALPISQFMSFTYRVPEHLKEKARPGFRVLVPFKKSKLTGVITSLSDKPQLKGIRDVEDIPDSLPVFTEDYLQILKKISEYYITPYGITLYYAMPEGLRWKYNREKKRWIKPAPEEKVYYLSSGAFQEKLTPSARKLVQFVAERGEVTSSALKEAGFKTSTINSLVRKGILIESGGYLAIEEELPTEEISVSEESYNKKGMFLLSGENAESRLRRYIHILKKTVNRGQTAMFILPNIASLRRVYPGFKREFGDRLRVYLDTIPEKQKIDLWFELMKNSGYIVLGTYSTLFIPAENLSLIIIEEEYSSGYKNPRMPRFDARRLGIEIYRKRNTAVILGSSIPSVETVYLSETGKVKKLIDREILTATDARLEIKKPDYTRPVDRQIINLLKDRNTTALIVTNRRGFSSYLYCPRCEDEIKCKRCDIPLKVHKSGKEKFLQCELCGKKYSFLQECPECETGLIETGFGTEKIMEILSAELGNEVSFLEEGINRINITASISGKDFLAPKYRVVVNILPDYLLYIPDFRGEELFFRSISLSYLKAEEKMILITSQENSLPSIKALTEKNSTIFYRKELENRKVMSLPPFSKWILLTFEKKGLTARQVEELFQRWIDTIGEKPEFEGPYTAIYSKIRGRDRFQILIKNIKNRKKLEKLFSLTGKKGIKLIIEPDPKQIK
ncbi:primosomal protein N' family DNA-binding protein [Persephonella sp.]